MTDRCARCHAPILPDEMPVVLQSTGATFHEECIHEGDTIRTLREVEA